MIEQRLKAALDQFDHKSEFKSYEAITSGHINDTYLIKTFKKPYFVLQRINQHIFKNVPELIQNKVAISHHISKKMDGRNQLQTTRQVLRFVRNKNGAYFHLDEDGNYWNLMYYIDNSISFETVQSESIAYEGGKLVGEFLALTSDFNVEKLNIVIPKFHDMSFRFSEFQLALKSASRRRLNEAEKYIKKVSELKEEMHILQYLKEAGRIKTRVSHNDTKLSNLLFNKENKGICMIDTDTIMPGIMHYDFGDAIRTMCNTAAEDETNLAMVEFNVDYYKSFKKGFIEQIQSTLTPLDLKYLPLAAKTMIFIMALRFLTDYLSGDVYFKINYPQHNFDRAKNQFKLLDSLSHRLAL